MAASLSRRLRISLKKGFPPSPSPQESSHPSLRAASPVLRNDHCNPHGHRRSHLPRQWAGQPLASARSPSPIGGFVCISPQLRRHLAGPEDRLPDRRHPTPGNSSSRILIESFGSPSPSSPLNASDPRPRILQRLPRPIAFSLSSAPRRRHNNGNFNPRSDRIKINPRRQRAGKQPQQFNIPANAIGLPHPRRTSSTSTTPPPARSKSSGRSIGSERAAAPQ